MPNDLTTYELARLRLQAFAMLDGWGTINEKGAHVPHNISRRKESADELVEWAIINQHRDRKPGEAG